LSRGTPHHGERPATFREVFASGEFRSLYFAGALSWFGDYLARAAITALVFQKTGSVLLSAAAFAISYTPWLLGGSLLVSLAERYPYRAVMVTCDLARLLIMAAVAVRLPLPLTLVLLLLSAMLTPPFEAARSATLPHVLTGDRYVVGLGVLHAAAQPAQVIGYLAGSALAVRWPYLALLGNAATFGLSAVVIRFGIRTSTPALDVAHRSHLMRETAEGFRLVFGRPVLRALAAMVFGAAIFVIVPEGLAAAWAAHLTGSSNVEAQGIDQGLIMAAAPIGVIIGGLSMTRLVSPSRRTALLRPFAVAAPLMLVPALLDPSPFVVALLACLCGFAVGGLVPVANGMFARSVPAEYRARAFGVMQGGLQVLQGAAVLVTGALAHFFRIPVVVGAWCVGGVGLMLGLSLLWPSRQILAEAEEAARPGMSAAPPSVSGARAEASRAEATRPEATRPEATRPGTTRPEASRPEAAGALPEVTRPGPRHGLGREAEPFGARASRIEPVDGSPAPAPRPAGTPADGVTRAAAAQPNLATPGTMDR
jgi:MFS transporter